LEEISNANITTSGSNSHSITLSPVVYLLINLSNTENELLERYLREKNYASLKELIDQKKAEFLQISNKPIGSSAAKEAAEDFETDAFLETPSVPLNFTQEQFEYAQAYHVKSNQIFSKSSEKYECYANEPTCVRALLDRCNVDELQELQRASDDDDLIMITDLIKDKLDDDPDLYIEYDKWTNANDVPEALKEITRGLSQAQRRAMEKLRRLKLTDKIKDFYRENIEKASSPKQEQIEMFFRRMNKTFARCYNPIIKKENDWRDFR
uniref:RNA polymerase sigma factor n=1 Tax=Gongylonema pulchrum TaxID=637853 RepID=A0A183E2Y1_9BILA